MLEPGARLSLELLRFSEPGTRLIRCVAVWRSALSMTVEQTSVLSLWTQT